MAIFYRFYVRDHLAVDCTSGIREIPKVISRFEKLRDSKKTTVLDNYYQKDLLFVRWRPEGEPANDVNDTIQQKNWLGES